MTANIGSITLILALVFCVYAAFSLALGIKNNNQNLIISAKNSLNLVFFMIVIVYVVLTISFLKNDFSRFFVFNNSSTDLPLFYKITGPWGGLEGSLVLWLIILCGYSFIVGLKYYKRFPALTAYSLLVLSLIQIFLLIILNVWSNPLAPQFPILGEGNGLNPLLQNPGMVIHPPLLYLGFVGFSIPFAFAISSLITNKLDNDWILLTRRWTMISWLFLTCGMIIGGLWAYHVLGWGGYWAWDPVENSSLLPWLSATTFLHSSLAQEKTKKLGMWNIALIILTFNLTILGTFITRSGILNSVHAFTKSNLGGAFLIFLAISLLFAFGLLLYRVIKREDKFVITNLLNKENLFLFNNLIFLVIIFAVLYGTIFPLISEALLGRQISIQAPFFNKISFPLVVILFVLMAITPLVAWKKSNLKNLWKNLWPALIGAFICFGLFYFLVVDSIYASLLVLCLYFNLHTISSSLYKYFKPNSYEKKVSIYTRFKISSRQIGAMIVHLGIIVLLFGIIGNFLSFEQKFILKKNQIVSLGLYDIKFEAEDTWMENNTTHKGVLLPISKDGIMVTTLKPSKVFYPTSEEIITDVAIYRNLFEDLYISLIQLDEDSITLHVYLNRLVLFIPLALLIIILGTAINFWHNKKQVSN